MAKAAFRDGTSDAARAMERGLRDGARDSGRSITIQRRRLPSSLLGQDALGFEVEWDRGDGPVRSVMLMVRVGRGLSFAMLDGPAARFAAADAYRVVAAMRERLRTGLAM